MTNIFTKYWSSGDTLTADDLNANFNDVSNILNGGIKTEHISTSANIPAEKIADRFYMVKTSIEVLPFSAASSPNAMLQNTTKFNIPVSETTITKQEIVAQAGYQGHLMAINVYVVDVGTGSGGEDPEVGIYLNSSLIGQRIALDQADANYRLHANNPFSNPLLAIADGDVISVKLKSSGSNAPTARGLSVVLYERWSIGS